MDQPYPITTVLVTGADRRLAIMENGREVLQADVDIPQDELLGEHVLVLKEGRNGHLGWTGVTHHTDPTHPLWPEEQVINRLRLVLSRLGSGLSTHLGGLSFECQGAFAA